MSEKVVIIGGGAIGLSAAYYLKQNNKKVVLLDKGEFGEGCSQGNMGWVCPLLTQPVPAPGLVGTSIKWMFKKDSPLYIKPSKIFMMSKWLFDFWRNCNKKSYESGKESLMNLQKNTFKLYEELLENGVDFEFHKKGFVFLFINEEGLKRKIKELSNKAKIMRHQAPVFLSYKKVREFVPHVSTNVIGGILLPDQMHVRPESLLKALTKRLKDDGVEMKTNTEVTDFKYKANKLISVITSKGEIEGTDFLLSAGAWSAPLLNKVGYNIPVEAGKGYSVTIDHPTVDFAYPMYLGDSSAGITPFNGEVRIGGTMELSGINLDYDKKRIKGIRNSVSQYLSRPLVGRSEIEWTGMRPMTPDGLPIIDKLTNMKNLFIATGHAMEGVALSLETGRLISQLISYGKTDYDTTPFRLDRFNI